MSRPVFPSALPAQGSVYCTHGMFHRRKSRRTYVARSVSSEHRAGHVRGIADPTLCSLAEMLQTALTPDSMLYPYIHPRQPSFLWQLLYAERSAEQSIVLTVVPYLQPGEGDENLCHAPSSVITTPWAPDSRAERGRHCGQLIVRPHASLLTSSVCPLNGRQSIQYRHTSAL